MIPRPSTLGLFGVAHVKKAMEKFFQGQFILYDQSLAKALVTILCFPR
jgi:hypothetical protein